MKITRVKNDVNGNTSPPYVSGTKLRLDQNKTSDCFGKHLQEFEQRRGVSEMEDEDDVPLVFWLLAGYFRSNKGHLKVQNIFNTTSKDADVREVELHMSQANYSYLRRTTVRD